MTRQQAGLANTSDVVRASCAMNSKGLMLDRSRHATDGVFDVDTSTKSDVPPPPATVLTGCLFTKCKCPQARVAARQAVMAAAAAEAAATAIVSGAVPAAVAAIRNATLLSAQALSAAAVSRGAGQAATDATGAATAAPIAAQAAAVAAAASTGQCFHTSSLCSDVCRHMPFMSGPASAALFVIGSAGCCRDDLFESCCSCDTRSGCCCSAGCRRSSQPSGSRSGSGECLGCCRHRCQQGSSRCAATRLLICVSSLLGGQNYMCTVRLQRYMSSTPTASCAKRRQCDRCSGCSS